MAKEKLPTFEIRLRVYGKSTSSWPGDPNRNRMLTLLNKDLHKLAQREKVHINNPSGCDFATIAGDLFAFLDKRVFAYKKVVPGSLYDGIVKLVRDLSGFDKCKFELIVRDLNVVEVAEFEVAKITAKRPLVWKAVSFADVKPTFSLDDISGFEKTFPRKIAYANELAAECYCVGGNESGAQFYNLIDLQDFLRHLSRPKKKEIIRIATRLARNKHHEWFFQFVEDTKDDETGGCDTPEWASEFDWLLSFLDRLKQGGLMKGLGNPTEKVALNFWDSFGLGVPCELKLEY